MSVTGDTTGKGAVGGDGCPGSDGGDDLYVVTPSVTGLLDVTVTPLAGTTTNMAFFVRGTCDDATTSLGCFDSASTGQAVAGEIAVTAGQPVFLYVGGQDGSKGPYSVAATSREIVCGDGRVDPGEDCEAPGTGDCDASCHFDFSSICAKATPLGEKTAGAAWPSAPNMFHEQLFSYTFPADGVLSVSLHSQSYPSMSARSTCADPATELARSDLGDDGLEGMDVVGAAGETLTLFVTDTSGASGPFTLYSAFNTITEVEPNDSSATATPLDGSGIGIVHDGDSDWYAIQVTTVPTQLLIYVEAVAPTVSDDYHARTSLSVFGPDGTTSLGDSKYVPGDNDAVVTTPSLTTPGTYYARVTPKPGTSTFAYQITVLSG